MIDKNAIAKVLADRVVDAEVFDERCLAFENINFKPPKGCELWGKMYVVPGDERPVAREHERAIFAVNCDVYVQQGRGTVQHRKAMKAIGDLFSPVEANSQFTVGSNEVGITSCYEGKGAPVGDGWFYSTVIVELKVL